MPEAFVHPSAVDFCDSAGSSRRNSQEIFDGPYYSTIDDQSSDGGYFSPAEVTTTIIQLNQEVHIDQSGLLSSAASTSSTQENPVDENKETESASTPDHHEVGQAETETETQAEAQEEQTKEQTISLSLPTSSLYDDMLRLREDVLVGGDNLLNVNICRLDDLRQAIARLQKETQALEMTDMILKRKIDYVVDRRVRVRQDLMEDMASGWEFV
ncbi:hypothetical protein Unana1_04654 [Umbelopsis nana]